jgi:hypothetical protein
MQKSDTITNCIRKLSENIMNNAELSSHEEAVLRCVKPSFGDQKVGAAVAAASASASVFGS